MKDHNLPTASELEEVREELRRVRHLDNQREWAVSARAFTRLTDWRSLIQDDPRARRGGGK